MAPISTTADPLSTTFAALADPTRRAILSRLAISAATVNELAEPFAISLPAISRHLRVLEGAGLIERARKAQWRPCALRAQPLRHANDWIESYRQFWEASLDRLGEYLAQLQRNPTPPPATTDAVAQPPEDVP